VRRPQSFFFKRQDVGVSEDQPERAVPRHPFVWQNAIFDWGVFSLPASASVGLVGGPHHPMGGCLEKPP